MSAISLVLHRNKRNSDAIGPASAARDATAPDALLAAMAHRGPDGWASRKIGPVRLGHQHWWATPEERGECQPICDRAARYFLSFDGRLDNRAELFAAMGPRDPRHSDAQLVLAAYERWGEKAFARLLGPFALVLFDVWRQVVICARDPMGQRALYYTFTDDGFMVATEESALLAHPDVSSEIHEGSVARYFAMRAPKPGATFFRAIHELLPGTAIVVPVMTVPASRDPLEEVRSWRFWEPTAARRDLSRHGDGELMEELRWVLRESVRCRLRGFADPAMLLSGGLDSTSVAALAAEQLGQSGRSLKTFSWVFPSFQDCDESPYIERMTQRWGLESHTVLGDGEWPLRDIETWPALPSRAYSNPHSRLLEASFRRARELGSCTLLTGYWGKQLYSASSDWLASLLRSGRFKEAGGWVISELGHGRRDWVGRVAGGIKHSLGFRAPDPWLDLLTPECRAMLEAEGETSQGSAFDASARARGLLTGFHPWTAAGRLEHARRLGVELREPYRDRRVVELFLNLPSHQVNRGRSRRHITREAMRGLLPESVRLRGDTTPLLSLSDRRVLQGEAASIRALLQESDPLWERFVRADGLKAGDTRALTALRLAVGFQLWLRRVRSLRSASAQQGAARAQ